MALLFDEERRTRCSIHLERDLAATAFASDKRAEHLQRASRLSKRLPGTRAERHLILGGCN